MATLNFDARAVPPSEAFEPIPPGWYNVRIIESEMKPTKDGNGSYLALTMQVIDGQYANRRVFDRLNLQNNNVTAMEIAHKNLSAICHATGIMMVQDSSQLHGAPFQARVTIRAASGEYDAQNEVKGYRAIPNGGAPAMAPPQQGWTQPPQATPPQAAPPQWGQQAPQQMAPPPQQPAWQPPPQLASPQQAPQAPWQGQQPQTPAPQSPPPAPAAQPNGPPAGAVPPWAAR